nr:XRE family transcriptional regulator [bacterium]
MGQNIGDIARRIRELREILELSAEDMAAATGLTAEEYLRQESGECDFSFTLLSRLAGKLHVDITDLISGESPKLTMYTVTRKGQGEKLERRREYRYEQLFANFSGRNGDCFVVTVAYDAAKQKPAALYSHEGQEMNYILSGTLGIWIDNQQEVLHAGDSILYDATHPHAMVALDGQDTVFLSVVMKDGKEG